ncbi:signal peptide peptidase SppA [Candidatus Micrarchaeota archaeon]|nr:signal peptide peptidase SppA [Candidatus Micrarchaeota archaeon]
MKFGLKHILIILVVLFVALFALALAFSPRGFAAGDCVGVLRVEGELTESGDSSGLFASGVSSYGVKELLNNAKSDFRVKALVLEINSPGGSAVTSKEIFEALKNFKARKPVVAYLSEAAASGGYYIASPADYIIANPNSITGSICARATFLNYEELFNKIGLREDTIKSGELKDVGSGTRNLTEEERKLVNDIIKETAQNFINDVVAARGNAVRGNPFFEKALDARILSANMALQAGLVDEIGVFDAALRKASALGNASVDESGIPETCELQAAPGLLDAFSQFGASFGKAFGNGVLASLKTAGSKPVLEYS